MGQAEKKNQKIKKIIEFVRGKITFFSIPTQLILNNLRSESLVVKRNPDVWKKICNNMGGQELSLPSDNKVADFINSFYCSGQSL